MGQGISYSDEQTAFGCASEEQDAHNHDIFWFSGELALYERISQFRNSTYIPTLIYPTIILGTIGGENGPLSSLENCRNECLTNFS